MNIAVQRVSRPVQDAVRDKPQQAVDIDQASTIKGMKADTLRKRLQRGQEDGFKGNDGKWKVYVSDVQDTSRTDREKSGTVQDDTRQVYQDLLNAVRVRIADKTGVIEYLKAQIEAKDSQLAAKDDQLAHKDKMLAQLIAKLPAVDGGRVEGLEKRNKMLAQLIAKLPAVDGGRVEGLEKRNQVLEIENKRNKLMLKKVYAIIRANQKPATRDSG